MVGSLPMTKHVTFTSRMTACGETKDAAKAVTIDFVLTTNWEMVRNCMVPCSACLKEIASVCAELAERFK